MRPPPGKIPAPEKNRRTKEPSARPGVVLRPPPDKTPVPETTNRTKGPTASSGQAQPELPQPDANRAIDQPADSSDGALQPQAEKTQGLSLLDLFGDLDDLFEPPTPPPTPPVTRASGLNAPDQLATGTTWPDLVPPATDTAPFPSVGPVAPGKDSSRLHRPVVFVTVAPGLTIPVPHHAVHHKRCHRTKVNGVRWDLKFDGNGRLRRARQS